MEEWRREFLKKIKTKAFVDSDFNGAFQAVLDDKNSTTETIEKGYVADQLIWHWNNLNESGHCYEFDKSIQKQKHNYKNVANNLLGKYFSKDDFAEWYLDMRGLVSVDGNTIQLI